MLPESTWTWVFAAVTCWVFLGLVAGRFHNCRRQIDRPGPIRRPAAPAGERLLP